MSQKSRTYLTNFWIYTRVLLSSNSFHSTYLLLPLPMGDPDLLKGVGLHPSPPLSPSHSPPLPRLRHLLWKFDGVHQLHIGNGSNTDLLSFAINNNCLMIHSGSEELLHYIYSELSSQVNAWSDCDKFTLQCYSFILGGRRQKTESWECSEGSRDP